MLAMESSVCSNTHFVHVFVALRSLSAEIDPCIQKYILCLRNSVRLSWELYDSQPKVTS